MDKEFVGWIILGGCIAIALFFLVRAVLQGNRAPAPQAPANPQQPGGNQPQSTPLDRVTGWFKSYGTILLVVAAIAIGYFGVYAHTLPTPTPTKIGAWSPAVWIWLVVIWGLVAWIVAINWNGETAKTLQKILAAVMIAILVGLPIWAKMTSASTNDGPVASPGVDMMSPLGDTMRRKPAPGNVLIYEGTGVQIFCVYVDPRHEKYAEVHVGEKCPKRDEPLDFQYAHDISGDGNTVRYRQEPW